MAETTHLDEIVARYAGRGRDALLPVLWDVQREAGFIDAETALSISRTLRVPVADIYGVIGFYSLFSDKPEGKTVIHVCADPSCGLAGADSVVDALCVRLGVRPGETTADGSYTVRRSTCLGLCEHAPAALVCRRGEGECSHAPVTSSVALLDGKRPARAAVVGGERHVFFPGVVPNQTESLAQYGDYAALRRALFALTPEQVSAEVEAAGLVGRGGAGFPTGMKWRFTRGAGGQPHYAVCNADESEPGTFKDRVLMEHRPHLLLEGLLLCAYAIQARYAFVFIRGEYPEAVAIMEAAIHEAQSGGLLGERIMGTDFSCAVEVRRGGGAYICGEETALFEAIEGKRGFPRIKPPYPTTHGLFNRPTSVNNVETLCAVPAIISNGAGWFRQWGTEKSTGTKLVSVSGHVRRPGVYEIPFGLRLRELLEGHCAGFVGELQAVLMGGAAGTFLRADEIDLPLTFEGLQAAGTTLGSGAVMVFNTEVDLRDVLRRLGHFFAHESCGKCFPCQLGTRRQMEILDRMGQPLPGDAERLCDIGLTMSEASLCGLGQTAAAAVLSALRKWPGLFAAGS